MMLDAQVRARLRVETGLAPGRYSVRVARCVARRQGHPAAWAQLHAHGGSLVVGTEGARSVEVDLDVYSLRGNVPLLARVLRGERYLCAAAHPGIRFRGRARDGTGTISVRRHAEDVTLTGTVLGAGERSAVMWLSADVRPLAPPVLPWLARLLLRYGLRFELVAELER